MNKQNLFLERLNRKTFLILSHRGFWGGNVIENTALACQLAYKAGADIAEVDVCRSSDGVYYLFHNGNEPKLLAKEPDFSTLDSKTIDSINVLNSLGNPSGRRIEKLADFLALLPEGALVNIDRSWGYWKDEKFFQMISASQKSPQIVLKSPVKKEFLTPLNERKCEVAYMPIITSQKEYEEVLNYSDVQMIGVEIVAEQEKADVLQQQWLSELKKEGLLVIANAEKLGAQFNLFSALDDDKALEDGYSEGWGKMLALGPNTLQTDWPNFLHEYRLEKERKPHE